MFPQPPPRLPPDVRPAAPFTTSSPSPFGDLSLGDCRFCYYACISYSKYSSRHIGYSLTCGNGPQALPGLYVSYLLELTCRDLCILLEVTYRASRGYMPRLMLPARGHMPSFSRLQAEINIFRDYIFPLEVSCRVARSYIPSLYLSTRGYIPSYLELHSEIKPFYSRLHTEILSTRSLMPRLKSSFSK